MVTQAKAAGAAFSISAVVVMATLGGLYLTRVHEKPKFLSPYIDDGKILEAQTLSLVKAKKDCDLENCLEALPKSHAGLITVDKDLGNHLFFWYFPSQENPDAPLAVHLNGRLGASSMIDLFLENGPLQIAIGKHSNGSDIEMNNVEVKRRNQSWVGPLSMLYVDSPVGVGFSFSDSGEEGLRTQLAQVTEDLFNFLQQFYQLFPECQNRDLYIGGQSHAGKYVPLLAHRIYEAVEKGDTSIPLSGIYLGGPYFAPELQLPVAWNYLYNVGAISLAQVERYRRDARKLIDDHLGKKLNGSEAERERYSFHHRYQNPEFVTNFVTGGPHFTSGLDSIMTTLISRHVQVAVNVGRVPFQAFNPKVAKRLASEELTSVRRELGFLLDTGLKVLIFNGDFDIRVNSEMIEEALLAIEWAWQAEYASAWRQSIMSWSAWNLKADYFFSRVRNLCRLVVHGAGHHVSHDQLKLTRRMMVEFVQNGCLEALPTFQV